MRKLRTTRNEKETPKYFVRINTTDHAEVTRERNPDSQWDGDDISHSHTIHGFEIVAEERSGWDFILNENPSGQTLFLVYALYDTGDSFHIESNCLCLISLVKNTTDANAIAKAMTQSSL